MTTLSNSLDVSLDYANLTRLQLPDVPRYARKFSERYYTFLALNQARRQAYTIDEATLMQGRWIILSDVHKGDGNPLTDDFTHNSKLYYQVLSHYLHGDYRLVLNGDVEECWKTSHHAILDVYDDSAFAIEREFARKGPDYYLRTYGNHDDDWADPRKVKKHLWPMLRRPVDVYPAISLGGKIMIAHGHQGDWTSDRIAYLSRRVVRRLWRPIQNVMNVQIDLQPAENHPMRSNRDQYLHQWAAAHQQLLIAGHTHRALFHPRINDPITYDNYINLGSCVHEDGLTGVEIEGGEIRLVKWSTNTTQQVERSLYGSEDLGALLARL